LITLLDLNSEIPRIRMIQDLRYYKNYNIFYITLEIYIYKIIHEYIHLKYYKIVKSSDWIINST